jgi:hypothetical protein
MSWLLQYQDKEQLHSVSNTVYYMLNQDNEKEDEKEKNETIQVEGERLSVEQNRQED